MKRREVARKPAERRKPLSTLKTVRVMALIAQTRPFLTPTAHRELRQFVGTLRDDEEAAELMKWGSVVLEADFRERYSLFRPETNAAVRACPLPIFSRPNGAFRVRWMFRPRNLRAIFEHLRRNVGGPKPSTPSSGRSPS